MKRAWIIGAVASSLLACRAQVVDLGSSDGGGPVSSSPLAGTWTGYIQAYELPSGSDALTIALTTQADGTVAGTVTFGDAPQPSPPTNPNVGYPLATQETPATVASIEGFPYTAQNVDVSMGGTRLQLDLSTYELWTSWCALQTPHLWPGYSPPTYGCSPDAALGGYGSGQCVDNSGPIDCGKGALCTSLVCTCTSTSCTVDTGPTDVHLDLQLQGDNLNGSASTTPFIESLSDNTTPAIAGHNILLTRSD